MVAINVQLYGDFDMPYVVCTLVHQELTKAEVNQDAKELKETYASSTDKDAVIKELKRRGYVVVHTADCAIGGNL